MLLEVVEERGVQLAKLVPQQPLGGEARTVDNLGSGQARFRFLQVVRYAAEDHIQSHDLRPHQFDAAAVEQSLRLRQRKGQETDAPRHPVVQPALRLDQVPTKSANTRSTAWT